MYNTPTRIVGSGDIFDGSTVVGIGRRKRAGESGGASRGGSTASTITGRGGVVHLVDWESGAGQIVR